jgi:hypothetical protein
LHLGSQDLPPPDLLFWGHLKSAVYTYHPQIIEALKEYIQENMTNSVRIYCMLSEYTSEEACDSGIVTLCTPFLPGNTRHTLLNYEFKRMMHVQDLCN